MKKLCAMIGVVCVVALLSGNALGLDIQLAPRTLVLSSGGDQLTIHTDVPFLAVDKAILDVGDTSGVSIATWADDCGNLVVRCSKEDVKVAAGDFNGKFTTVSVALTVEFGEKGESACEILRVRK